MAPVGIWKVNEALGSWPKVATSLEADEFVRELRASPALVRTRRFVCWVEICADGSRRELVRGEA